MPTWNARLSPDEPPSSPGGGSRSSSGSESETSNSPPPPPADIFDRLADWDKPPDRIGPYKILKKLGTGGFGVTFLGQRDDNSQAGYRHRVAIKVLKKGMDTDEVIKRFLLERRVLGLLDHPNIVRYIDQGESGDGRAYFVMEYVEGERLDEYCDRLQLTVAERLKLFVTICGAVQYAHTNNVVHRDLKPSNILVDAKGVPKLLDFGIAKVVNPNIVDVAFATEGVRGPMTPDYASPEQVLGKPLDNRTDVYSLGVILYELLTGRRPYRLKDRMREALIDAIVQQDPDKPSTVVTRDETMQTADGHTETVAAAAFAKVREGQTTRLRRRLSGDVDTIVLSAMHKSPVRRYQTVEKLGDDIQRHLDGEPITARPQSTWYRTAKFVSRHRAGVAIAGLLLATIVGSAVGMGVLWQRAERLSASLAARNAEIESSRKDLADVALGVSKQLDTQFIKTEGAAPATRVLAQSALDLATLVRKQFPTSAAWRDAQASALTMLGDVQGGRRGQSEGDTAAALASYEQALVLRRQALSEAPGDQASKRLLAMLLIRMTDVQRTGPAASKAAATCDEAVTLAEQATGSASGDEKFETQRALAIALLTRAELRRADAVAAGKDIERSLAIRRELLTQKPGDPRLRRDLATALDRVAELASDDAELALKTRREILTLRRDALRADRNDTTRRDAGVAQEKLGALLRDLDTEHAAEARALLIAARDEFADLRDGNPSSARGTWDLARACNQLAHLDLKDHKPEDAARGFRAAAKIMGDLTQRPSPQSHHHFELAIALEGLADSALAMNDAKQAREQLAQALSAYEAAAGDKRTPDYQDPIDRVRAKLGELR